MYSLTAEDLPPSDVTRTNVYEALYQSSAPVNIVDNPSYQQHSLEPKYGYPKITHISNQGVSIMVTDSGTNGL